MLDEDANSKPMPRQATTVMPSNSRSMTIEDSAQTRETPKLCFRNSARSNSPSRAGMTVFKP